MTEVLLQQSSAAFLRVQDRADAVGMDGMGGAEIDAPAGEALQSAVVLVDALHIVLGVHVLISVAAGGEHHHGLQLGLAGGQGLGDAVGFVKVVADAEHNEIIGAHMIGPDVTELLPAVNVAQTWDLTADEVSRAIGHLTGSIRLGLDDPLSRMTRIGRHLLDRDEVVSVDESVSRLRRVTSDEVVAYWERESAPWCLAAVGPGMPDGGAAGLLARLAG